jgi:hypothetical protein
MVKPVLIADTNPDCDLFILEEILNLDIISDRYEYLSVYSEMLLLVILGNFFE